MAVNRGRTAQRKRRKAEALKKLKQSTTQIGKSSQKK
jgi:hypothetical protein